MVLFSALLFFILSLISDRVDAAPCCAGSNAVPALITGDEAELYQLGVTYETIIGDAPGLGSGIPVFRDAQSIAENRGLLTLNYARLVDRDRLQAGISIPIQFNDLTYGTTAEKLFKLSDLSLTLGYETLPEWNYSLLIPRIFSFFQMVLPTGSSIYDSKTKLASDVSGLGQYQASLGSIAIKKWSDWDLNLLAKGGMIFGQNFSDGTSVGTSFGGTTSLGLGYLPLERLRLGSSLALDFQSPVEGLNANTQFQTSEKLVWNANLNATLLLGMENALVVGYQDQTWFGPAYNTSLGRSAYLSFSHRVER